MSTNVSAALTLYCTSVYLSKMELSDANIGGLSAPPEDLNFILKKLAPVFQTDDFRNESILLTGGTGFFGKWLTQTLLAMNDQWNLKNSLTILTRSKAKACNELPWLAYRPDVHFIESDIRSLKTEQEFSTIIHGAAAASRDLNENHPEEMFNTILDGTRAILKVAEDSKVKRVQLISSGAVYGTQPGKLDRVDELFTGAPDTTDPRSSYGEAKRAAEFLSVCSARKHGYHLSIARCYSFIGPYLPLDIHFAAGNFLKAVLDNDPIKIGGDGSPFRSYLYSADLIVWLLTILVKGESSKPYNVGSEDPVSILDLAKAIDLQGKKLVPDREKLSPSLMVAKT
ncbi:MAG: NAD-dependent epimerase/dehydratase family protein, partial [Pseudobdellovibrionaceae bacterium]